MAIEFNALPANIRNATANPVTLPSGERGFRGEDGTFYPESVLQGTAPTPPAIPTANTPLGRVEDIISRYDVAPVDTGQKEAIRQAKLKQAQTEIDAVNAVFDRILAREQKAGEERQAAVRGLNIASGLAGSTFATSSRLRQEDVNREELNKIEAERGAKVEAILSGARARADEEIRAEQAARQGNLNALIAFQDKALNAAREDIKSLGQAGQAFEGLDENTKNTLRRYSGLGDSSIKAIMLANRPADQIIDKITQGNKMVFIKRDPKAASGYSTETLELPFQLQANQDVEINKDTGQAIITTWSGEKGKSNATITVQDIGGFKADEAKTADLALKKAQTAKTEAETIKTKKETEAVGVEDSTKIINDLLAKEPVQDLQIRADAYNTIKAVLPKATDELTINDVDSQIVRTVATQFIRAQNPKASRLGDLGDVLSANSVQSKAEELVNKWLKDIPANLNEIKSAVKRTEQIYEGSVTSARKVTEVIKKESKKPEIVEDLFNSLLSGKPINNSLPSPAKSSVIPTAEAGGFKITVGNEVWEFPTQDALDSFKKDLQIK